LVHDESVVVLQPLDAAFLEIEWCVLLNKGSDARNRNRSFMAIKLCEKGVSPLTTRSNSHSPNVIDVLVSIYTYVKLGPTFSRIFDSNASRRALAVMAPVCCSEKTRQSLSTRETVFHIALF